MMNLDEFADYKLSIEDRNTAFLRHANCSKRWTERIELSPPLCETNLKWLMLRATIHWQEIHQNEQSDSKKV